MMKLLKIFTLICSLLLLQGCSLFDTFTEKTFPAETYSGWQTITIPGLVTYQIPPTLELQNEALLKRYAQEKDAFASIKKSTRVPIIAQQKGLNANTPESADTYARVTMNIIVPPSNVPKLGETIRMPDKDLTAFDTNFRKGVEDSNKIPGKTFTYTKWEPMRITNINGIDCLHSYYEFTKDNEPTVGVTTYIIFNKDVLYNIQIAYDLAHKEAWTKAPNDLRNVIKAVQFKNR